MWLFQAVVAGKTTTSDDLALPPPLSTDPPCPTGEQWSHTADLCCRICAAGTGAIGACVSRASATGDNSNSDNDVPVTISNYNNNGSMERVVVNGCQQCLEGSTYSHGPSHDQPCRACSACPKNARTVSTCNVTHDTVCECEPGLFYLSQRSGQCELCDLCPVGWGASTPCGAGNTVCRKCQNGTYSDVLDATAPCRPCSVCTEGQRMLQECTATQDTICLSKCKSRLFRCVLSPLHTRRRSVDLRTVFHSINSRDKSPLSHSVLPVLFFALLVLSIIYLFMKVSLSPDIILCG